MLESVRVAYQRTPLVGRLEARKEEHAELVEQLCCIDQHAAGSRTGHLVENSCRELYAYKFTITIHKDISLILTLLVLQFYANLHTLIMHKYNTTRKDPESGQSSEIFVHLVKYNLQYMRGVCLFLQSSFEKLSCTS